ncbi:MAG TPA: hypothetical protein VHG35_11125 [Gemmatimonadales bacterium]|nr:hypothetical protein [Gemmatimonadales bacterium]
MGPAHAHIERADAARILTAAADGSLLVTGQPGIGKSAALSGFVDLAEASGADVVVVSAGEINAGTLGGLRAEFGLQHEVEDVLENWPGGPGYLVVDALDAARGEAAARALRDLIAGVIQGGGRWTVIASVREFDLRYSPELQRLFHGQPVSAGGQNSPDLAGIRVVTVGPLEDRELEQLADVAPQLHGFISTTPDAVRSLLRVPFNLRLAAELLTSGVNASELLDVRTQLDLLDRYWRARVHAGGRAGAGLQREEVLRRLCNAMVKDRSLNVPQHRLLANDLLAAEPLDELLRLHVLTEWQPSADSPVDPTLVAFSHHVLFDYAVARLLVRHASADLASKLAHDPDFAVIVRPSLVLHFHYLWGEGANHNGFWTAVLQIMRREDVPQIGKIIGPSVAADLAANVEDFDPLLDSLTDPGEHHAAAEEALRHVVGTLIARGDAQTWPLSPVWAGLSERISRRLEGQLPGTLRVLLNFLSEYAVQWDPAAMEDAGRASRRLLAHAWESEPYSSWLATSGIELVSWTFDTDPAASAALLRRGLAVEHLRLHGAEEMRFYADEVDRLAGLDPELTAEIYEAAFDFVEDSEEKTAFGGPVMSFTGTRRQDYRLAEYSLAKAFPKFLLQAPEHATRALIRAVAARFGREYDLSKFLTDTFDFRGHRVEFLHDRSNVWGRHHRRHEDNVHDMLEDFEAYLTRAEPAVIERIVRVVVGENRLAIFWAHLLDAGATAPETVGLYLAPLGWTAPLLSADETVREAARFLSAVFPHLDDEGRARIEKAVLGLSTSGDDQEWLERRRNRLLMQFDRTLMRTPEAVSLAEQLNTGEGSKVETDEPYPGVYSRAVGTREYLAMQGVKVDEPSSQRILQHTEPLAPFNSAFLNDEPDADALRATIPLARSLREGLVAPEAGDMDPKQIAYAWGVLASTCETCARAKVLDCNDADGAFVRDVLLAAMERPEPVPDPAGDESFDAHPSWGSPSSRIEAAQGLLSLARKEGCTSGDILDAVERLSADPSPAVRYQVSARAVWLFQVAPDRMWRIVERMAAEDSSRGVVRGLLSGALDPLAGHSPDRVAGLVTTILQRTRGGPGVDEVRGRCVEILAKQAVWLGNRAAESAIAALLDAVGESADELSHVKPVLRHVLTYGPVEPSDPAADRVRRRGIELAAELTRRSVAAFRAAVEHAADIDAAERDGHDERLQELAQLLDGLAFEIYLASGAHDDPDPEEPAPDTSQRRRFYWEIGSVVDLLAEVGLAPLTHHLLEALEAFTQFDPRGVFLRVSSVVEGGRKGNYPYDSLAQRTVIGLVERFLADHRDIFREDAECRRALVKILDIFVDAGWPRARQLTYRLEEIFR